jgi:glycine/D-amino acid oxidase-like deaminating enzyme
MTYDYCIVGQGLAGSALAIHMLKRKLRFLLYDEPDKNYSSSAAAGIFNPVTGKNWVKTWKADDLFPYMHSYYKEVEAMSHGSFLNEKLIYRPFSSLDHQNDWMGKSENAAFSDFINAVYTKPVDTHIVDNPYGGLELRSGGNLNIAQYLNAVRKLLDEIDCYRMEHFDFKEVKIEDTLCHYKGHQFKKIVFCQGPVFASEGPGDFLPFRLVKGEVLTARVKEHFDKIYNKGVFVLPLGEDTCRIGATYDNKNPNTEITEEGKMRLQEKLSAFFKPAYEILGHLAGVRPATVDRKPFLGVHPNDKKLVIFNGLGAKGVTLAPYFANHLLEYLENDGILMKEVDLNRFIR